MEGLTAFVSKFDNNSPRDSGSLKRISPVINSNSNQEKKDCLSTSGSQPVLPVSIEGILGRNDETRTDTRHTETARLSVELNQGTQHKTLLSRMFYTLCKYFILQLVEFITRVPNIQGKYLYLWYSSKL